ncbi:MAG: hypothetical protein ACOYXW_17625 [Actinomycetota bacterium]
MSGLAGTIVTLTLLAGVAGFFTDRLAVRPWLVVLYGINAGHVSRETLRAVRPVDVALLLLAGGTYAGFWPGPGGTQILWMSVAIAQPLLGIVILLATHLWGRSGLMGGALALSILMIFNATSTGVGWLGAAASVLLLAGDFGTTDRPSRLLATCLAVGYGALIAWFGWLAILLLT